MCRTTRRREQHPGRQRGRLHRRPEDRDRRGSEPLDGRHRRGWNGRSDHAGHRHTRGANVLSGRVRWGSVPAKRSPSITDRLARRTTRSAPPRHLAQPFDRAAEGPAPPAQAGPQVTDLGEASGHQAHAEGARARLPPLDLLLRARRRHGGARLRAHRVRRRVSGTVACPQSCVTAGG